MSRAHDGSAGARGSAGGTWSFCSASTLSRKQSERTPRRTTAMIASAGSSRPAETRSSGRSDVLTGGTDGRTPPVRRAHVSAPRRAVPGLIGPEPYWRLRHVRSQPYDGRHGGPALLAWGDDRRPLAATLPARAPLRRARQRPTPACVEGDAAMHAAVGRRDSTLSTPSSPAVCAPESSRSSAAPRGSARRRSRCRSPDRSSQCRPPGALRLVRARRRQPARAAACRGGWRASRSRCGVAQGRPRARRG